MSEADQLAAVMNMINDMISLRGLSDEQWSEIASELPPGYSIGVQSFGSAFIFAGSYGTVYGWDGAQTSTTTDGGGVARGFAVGGVEVDFIKGNGQDVGGFSNQKASALGEGSGYSVPDGGPLPISTSTFKDVADWLTSPETAPGSSYFISQGLQIGGGFARTYTTPFNTEYPNGVTVNTINLPGTNLSAGVGADAQALSAFSQIATPTTASFDNAQTQITGADSIGSRDFVTIPGTAVAFPDGSYYVNPSTQYLPADQVFPGYTPDTAPGGLIPFELSTNPSGAAATGQLGDYGNIPGGGAFNLLPLADAQTQSETGSSFAAAIAAGMDRAAANPAGGEQVAFADMGVASDGGYGGSAYINPGAYGANAGVTALYGQGAADAGVSAGSIGGSNSAVIDAGGPTQVQVSGTDTLSYLAANPTQIPTSLDSSAFATATTFTASTTQSSNVSYAGIDYSNPDLPQAASVTQSAPVNTIGTGTAEGGDLGALAGGFLDGVAGIFGGIVDGIAGLVSGIFGGGNSGAPSGNYSGGYSGGGFSGGFSSGGGYPVVLDLAGKGIKITPLSSSNMFFDMANKGYAQRTAWAGAGNGVLVYDPTGGPVTQANQVNFTLWDPTAKNDMQALQHVFDTNHDGVLNASDASWSKFRILVTNADGTTTLETLAQAGVTAINLTPNAYHQGFTDGSSIGGETTFTRANGTTGTAATVTFANDGGAYIMHQTVAHNGDGSTTLTNAAYNIDGTLAETVAATTSASGLNKTTVTSDGSGAVIPLSCLYRNVPRREPQAADSLRLAA